MAPRLALAFEEAKELKVAIWNGRTNAEVAIAFGISVPTVSRTKVGMAYSDAPWPDGSVGAIAQHRLEYLSKARRFSTNGKNSLGDAFVEDEIPEWEKALKRHGISLDEANEVARRESRGKMSYEQIAEKFVVVARSFMDSVAKQKHEERMKDYERREKEFNMPKNKAKRRQEELERAMKDNSLPHNQCNPENEEKYTWEEILAIARNHIIVIVSDQDPFDPARRLAIQIVYKKISQQEWGQKYVTTLVMQVRDMIENFWRAHPEERPDPEPS